MPKKSHKPLSLPPSPSAAKLGIRGDRVRAARAALGWSSLKLAYNLGVGPADVSRIETGKNVMDYKLVSIALMLGVSTDYLCGLTDDPTPHGRKP